MILTDNRKKKRMDCDYKETGLLYRDNNRPRRVDPDRLAARLPEGLVKGIRSEVHQSWTDHQRNGLLYISWCRYALVCHQERPAGALYGG